MRILYFDWNEFTGPDCKEVMTRLGHTVGIFKHLWNCRSEDEEFAEKTERALLSKQAAGEDGRDYGLPRESAPQWDAVFSFNYYPIISEVCESFGVRYISWTFDSPYLPVTSTTNRNPVNTIWLFDHALCEKMRQSGIETVKYMPLAVNGKRMRAMNEELHRRGGERYDHEISFVGGLYADKNNFYNMISENIPPFLKSYLEDVMQLQMNVFGRDIIGDASVVTEDILTELKRFIRFEVPEVYEIDYDELIRDMLRTQATEMDRFSLLEVLGRTREVSLYTRYDSPPLKGVRNLGYASYIDKMPRVFYRSRVNLNVTLRTIRTGMPLRALDVMAAGGFLLSTWQEELAEYFDNGVHLALARDPEEFIVLAEWFADHDEAREKIARAGQERVIERFDYERLLPEVMGEGK